MKTRIETCLWVVILLALGVLVSGIPSAAAAPQDPRLGNEESAERPAQQTGWLYRRAVTINNSGAALTNYQVRVALDNTFTWSHANNDGSDVRFTSANGTAIPYWIENWTPSTSANLWVNVPSLAASTTTTIYLYYGNASAGSASDGTSTFIFFDDNWTQFTGGGGNPVQYATQSWWESTTSYPVVFEDTSFLPGRPRYHMLYDGHNVIGHAKGYAYSSDLRTWTEYDNGLSGSSRINPIMGTGYFGNSPFAWGDVIRVGSTYYMYPSQGPGTTVRVESTNLENWSNLQSLVVTGDAGGIGTGVAILKQGDGITPITVDNRYWMIYFHGFSPGTMYLAYADVAGDLLHWTSVGVLLSPTPGTWDAAGLWTPSFVRFNNNKYYIYYQGDAGGGFWETGYASADAFDAGNNPVRPDATTWTKSAQAVIRHGAGGSWDSGYCIDPMIRQFSDGVYYVFYTGNSANGYATATSPEGPWTKLSPPAGGWTTIGGNPTVSNGVLSLTSSRGINSTATFQYRAVGYRANFPVQTAVVNIWGGFITGSSGARTMIGTNRGLFDSTLNLRNLNTTEAAPVVLPGSWLGAWHTYEVLWRNGWSAGVVDHGTPTSSTTQVPTSALPVTFYNFNDAAHTLQVDWVFVRQYRDPEPTISYPIGGEENNPTAVTLSLFTAQPASDTTSLGPEFVLGLGVGALMLVGACALVRRKKKK